MPIHEEPVPRRWTEQRWSIDQTIALVGPEWDQGRFSQIVTAAGAETLSDVAAIRARAKRFVDIGPACEAIARRRETRAEEALAEKRIVTARDNFYLAASYWATAQWPIVRNDDENWAMNARKRYCFESYGRLADHHVESVAIPFHGKTLPAYLHLPPGHTDGRIPVVVSIPGMDGFKERLVQLSGDRWLSRGIAVLALEGPGQYEAALNGIPMTTARWAEAGTACIDWLLTKPQIDPNGIAITGHSFGSFFATIAFAGDPRFRACAVSGTVFEPGGYSIFEEACPSYKRRFMYMCGFVDEPAFDEFAKSITWENYSNNIRSPYLCVTGEFDRLSPLEYTEAMFATIAGPKMLLVYQDADHAIGGTPASHNGPYFLTFMADWTVDRLAGAEMPSQRWFVESSGKIVKENYAN
jgi:dienelactone hydrolase